MHPYALTRKEAEKIVALLPPAKTFVDLFAGSGIVSLVALESGKYKEVIYCDRRKWVDLPVEQRIEDYREVLKETDKNTVIFADPFFYRVYNYDHRWNGKREHEIFVKEITEAEFKAVYILNTPAFYELLPVRSVKIGTKDEIPMEIYHYRRKDSGAGRK